MGRAWVHVALAGSDDYITGDPASASTLVVKDFADFPYVYIDDAGTVVEGGDLVFTLHRTGEAEGSLTAQLQMRVRKFASFIPYSYHEVTFEPGSLTTTFTVPTQDNELNDGNRQYRINLVLDTLLPDGPDVHSIYWGYQIGSTYEHRYPPVGEGWVRDDDIPTVWITPETGDHIEDPEGGSPQFTVHRDSDTSTWSYVFTSARQLRRWPPPIPDSLYTNPGLPKNADAAFWLLPGKSSETRNVDPRFVGPLGGESAVFLLPNYCGEDVLGDCVIFPQYHIGTPSSGLIQVYNRFAGIMVEPVEAEVEEGEAAVFRLTRFGGTPVSNDHPLTVWIEVTQDGEYIEGIPPQTVKFRGWPETSVEGADDTITLSIPTTDDEDDERHGAITLRVLPPETIDVDEPSSYEVGVDQVLAPFETGTVRVNDNDYYPPPISISDARAGEADGSMDFFVTVAPSEREMSVDWNTVTESGVGVATADTDYDSASGTLTFAVGETTKTITVDVLDDELNETEETFKVTLSGERNATLGDSSGAGVIEDDDAGTVVTIYPRGPYGGTEEGQPAEFILQRVGGTGAIYVELEISQQGDFLWSLQDATIRPQIPAGVNEVTVEITTIDDSAVESNGSVTATIKPRYYYSPGKPDTATVNMRDNDRILSISDAEAGEGQGSMTFAVTLSAAAENQVRVEVFTVPGKATSDANITETSLGRDFEAKTEFLVFDPGETEKSFTVTLVDDAIDESKEDFTVMLFRPTSNVWVTDASATGAIEDNDDPMEVRIVREVRRVDENQGSAVLFAVELVHDDTLGSERDTRLFWEVKPGAAAQDAAAQNAATEGDDYAKPYSQQRGTLDIPIGHLTANLEVDLIDDNLLEPQLETFTVELVEGRRLVLPANEDQRKVQISIRDDERLNAAISPVTDSVIEGDDAVFEVRLSGGVTTESTVLEYAVAGTATSGDDYTAPSGMLTIPAGRDIGTITIPVLEDSTLDPDETVEVTLTSGASGSRKARIPDPIAAVTIVESGTMTVSVASAEAEEGGTLSFAVTLSLASQDDVTVDWETADDPDAVSAATADVDYERANGTLTVPAGSTSAVITVQTSEDTLAGEGDETFRVNLTRAHSLSSSPSDDLPLGVSTAIGTIWDNDIAPTGITLTAAPDRVSEDAGATAVTVTATLDGQRSLARDTRVQLALEDGAAAADDDFEPATALLTIPAGRMSASATLTLTPVDDSVWEGDETVTIAGTAGDLAVTPAEVTIADDDAAPTGVTLTLAPAVVGEAAGETDLTVTATLTGGDSRIADTEVTLSVEGVSLTLDDGNGTATATTAATGDDFTYATTTVVIPAGQTGGSGTLTFTPVDDTFAEGDETAQVSGTAAGLIVTAAGLTIEDNDQEPTRIALSVTPAEVSEGSGDTTLTVTATLEGGGSRTSATGVSLTVEGVTATAGADFTAEEGVTLTIPAGRLNHTAELTLTPADDNLAEGKEELSIGGSNTEPGLPVYGVRVDLNDNDAEPTKITLSLNKNYVEENRGSQWLTVTAALEGNSRRTVDTSVRLRVDGGTATTADYWALAGDLVIEAGEREGTADIVLAPTDDHIDEDDETLEVWGSTTRSRSAAPLQVSREQVTIRDDDTAGVTVTPTELPVVEGQSNSYRVVLDSQPTGDVTIAVSVPADTGITVEPASLTFTPGNWNISQEVTVTPAHDDDNTPSPDVTLTHTVSGGDYEGLKADDVVVSITEDDEPGVTLTPDTLDIDEGASDTYTVVLDTEPTADVTVAIAGHADTDITLTGATLTDDAITFTAENWDTAQTVTVTAKEDDDAVDEEEATLTHTVTGTGEYAGVTADSVTVTITDDDTAGVTISESALTIDEGASDTYTVVLDTKPTRDVTVAIAGHADTDITLSGATLTDDAMTFTAENWDAAQTVTVTAKEDDDAASDAAVTLTHTANGGGYVDVQETVTVTVVEKDASVLSVGDAEAAEDGGNVVFTVSISAASGEEVTVDYATSDGSATEGQDYTETTGTLTFAALVADSQTILVPIIDDTDDEDEEETFTLTLSNVQVASLFGGGETLAVTGTITDDDDPAVTASFGQASYSVDEGGTVEVKVTLSADPEREVAIPLTHDPQGGATDADYSGVPENVVFQRGDTEKSFTFRAAADDIDDDGESVGLGFGTLLDGVSAGTTSTVTINDDDTAGVTVSETALDIDEGGSATYTVALDTEPTGDVTVAIAGHADTDLSLDKTSLTFTADNWDTAQTVTVTAKEDDDAASDAAVTLTHTVTGTGEYAGVTADSVTVTITDNDSAGVTVSESTLDINEGGSDTYTVVLDTEPTADVTVGIAGHADTDITLSGDTLTDDTLTFTPDNWDTAQTVTVTAKEDDDAVDEEEATLTHTVTGTGEYAGVTADSVTVTILEKDASVLSVGDAEAAEDGGNVVFTVSISAANGEEVTADYATSDDTATAGEDYTETTGTLTFPANSVVSRTVLVPVTDDADDEDEEETFTLTLSNVQSASLFGGGETLAVTGTITDDDDPAVTASFGQASYSVDEGGTVEVKVTVSADPEREVAIPLTHDPQGGATDADYSDVPENVVFQRGDTEKSFTFSAAVDDIDDDGESVALGFGTMPDDVSAGTTATVTITDDDTAGVTVSKTALEIDEGGSATYTVALDTEPTGDVTIAIAGHADTDLSLDKTSLTFTADNWDTAQTVTVTADEDNDAASDAAVTLTHTVTGTGEYAGVTADSVTVTITDDDTASPSLDLSLPVPTHNDADDSGDVTLNDVLTYTATATNNGNVPLSGVTLSDLLVDEDGHDCGSLDIGEECELTGTHTVTQADVDAGVVTNTVTANANDLTTAVTASQQTPVTQESALTLTKTTTATGFTSVGDTIAYSYEVTNSGTVTLSGTPAISDDKIASPDITCGAVPDGGLAPLASVTCSGTYAVVQADLDSEGVTNKASASLAGVTSNEATATVAWKAPQAFTEPQVTIEVAVQVTEDAGTAGVVVTLSETSLQTVTVDYATSDGTATAGTDYVASSATLTFAPGETEKEIQVTITDDAVDEDEEDETFTVTLSNPNNASLGASASIVTITDDDDPAVTASFGQASYSVDEGGTIEVTVTLSADPEREVTIPLTHEPENGADPDADYSGVPENVVFQRGDTEKSFTFSAAADDIDDDGESVALGFGTMPDDVSAGTTATVSITDDDVAGCDGLGDCSGASTRAIAPPTQWCLNTQPTGDVTVAIAGHADTDITLTGATLTNNALTFTAENWDTAQTVTVTIAEDDDAASAAAVILTHTANGGGYVDVQETVTVTVVEKDKAGVTVSKSTLEIHEGASDTYTVVLDTEPTADVTVAIAGHADTDITLTGDTLTNNALTFTAENWDTAQTVTVTAAEDDDAASDVAVILTHTANGGGYVDVQETVTVTVVENDASVLSVSNAEAAEDGGNVVFTVSISAASGEEVTVDYATSDGSATEGQDYTETTGTLTFPANSVVSRTVSVPVTDDTVDEDEEETFTLTLSNVQVASLFGGGETLAVTGTITDDDDPAVTASFGQASYSVDEGGTVEVTVTLSADPEREVAILLTHDPQGGATDADYSGVPENVVFQRGDTEKSFTFTAAADDIDDDGESVALGFGTLPDDVSAGNTATVSITDDDTAGVTVSKSTLEIDEGASDTYTVVLDTEPTGDVTVAIAGHANTDITLTGATLTNNALTFTSDNWDTAQTVTVTAGEDDDAASAAAVILTHTANGGGYVDVQETVTVTILEKDASVLSVGDARAAEDGGNVVFTVSISAASGEEVTVDYATSDGTATAGEDYAETTGTLIFPANSVVSQSILVPIIDDTEDEDEEETFTLKLSNVQVASLFGGGEILAVTGTITDNDDRGMTIAPTELTIGEGEAGQYTVVLDTLPSETVTVDIGGYSGTDVSVSPAIPLTFTTGNWSQAQTVTVSVGEDEDTSADPAVTLTHSVAGGDYQGQNAAGVTVTITESDQVEPPSVTVSFEKGYHHVAEGASAVGVGLLLSVAPESDVTITIVVLPQSTAGAEDYSGVPNGITFAAGETYTYFWVYPVADTVEEEDEQVWFGLGPLPDGVSAGNYSQTYVTIFDAAHVSFDSSSYSATEGGDDAVVTVRLNKPLPNGETIPLTAEGGSGATSDDWSEVPDELYFAAGETEKTFTVIAVDDTVEDDGEMVTLGFGTLSDRLIAVSPATAVITLMNMEEPTTTHGLPACSDSGPLMVGAVYSGNIETAGQSEWFNFYLEPYKSYIIEIKGVDTGDGTLEDPALLQWRSALSSFHAILPLPSSVTGNRNVERTVWVSIPGVHCFEVASGDNGTGTYKLELRINKNRASGGGPDGYGGHDVPADTSTRAWAIVDIEATYGYLGDDGTAEDDVDWFRIDLNRDVEYQIDLETLTIDADGLDIEERHLLKRPRIAGIHDANGVEIQDTASTGQGMEVSVDFTPPNDGAYYIAVGSNSGDRTGLFQLCVKEKESSGTNRCTEDAPPQQDSLQQQTELRNSPATGGPGIAGSARAGKTLTATTQGISDEDGLTRAVFRYRWIRHDFGTGTDTDIGGATGASYTVTSDDAGQAIKVRVSFGDDAGYEESVTSYAVAVQAQPLTAEFPESPFQSQSHKGANDRPQVIVAFSRAVPSIAETTPSVLVTGGTVFSVRAHEEDGLEHAWVFFLDPAGTDDIHFTLLSGQSCEAGGICAADGTTLSEAPATRTIPGPEEEEDETEPQQQQQEPSGPPAKPTGLATTVSHNTVTLTWANPNDDSITGYVILRRDKDIHDEGIFLTVAPDTGSAETTYIDASIEPERRYVYRIKAINAGGVSERSSWVRAYTPAVPDPAPEAPARATGLSAAVSHDSVTLSWANPNDGSITGYVILRRDKDLQPEDGTFFTVVSDTGSAGTTYTDDTAEPDKRYVYRIKAINEHGEMSEISSWVRAFTPSASGLFQTAAENPTLTATPRPIPPHSPTVSRWESRRASTPLPEHAGPRPAGTWA